MSLAWRHQHGLEMTNDWFATLITKYWGSAYREQESTRSHQSE
jgi:hypothetical protein